MALPITFIPVLTGKVALDFIEKADYNMKHKRGSIDFSKEYASYKKIMSKAKL